MIINNRSWVSNTCIKRNIFSLISAIGESIIVVESFILRRCTGLTDIKAHPLSD